MQKETASACPSWCLVLQRKRIYFICRSLIFVKTNIMVKQSWNSLWKSPGNKRKRRTSEKNKVSKWGVMKALAEEKLLMRTAAREARAPLQTNPGRIEPHRRTERDTETWDCLWSCAHERKELSATTPPFCLNQLECFLCAPEMTLTFRTAFPSSLTLYEEHNHEIDSLLHLSSEVH